MHSATQVYQTARPLDQRRQHVRSERVNGEDGRVSLGRRGSARRGICAGVVDDCVHAADRIHLVCDTSRLEAAGKVADDDTGRAGSKIVDRRGALAGSRVQSDLMALVYERLRCGMAETVRAARDENASHQSAITTNVCGGTITSSPTFNRSTPSPTDSMTPAASIPGMPGEPFAYTSGFLRIKMSVGLTAAALTAIRTSLAPAARTGWSVTVRTSGPPALVTVTARIPCPAYLRPQIVRAEPSV